MLSWRGRSGPTARCRAPRGGGAGGAQDELAEGRTTAHFERRLALQSELRAGYARVLGCDTADVALTTSTSEGLGAVMAGMDIGPGDEIVSSDEEHPGLIGPLKAARERGADVRLGSRSPNEVDEDEFISTILERVRPAMRSHGIVGETAEDLEKAVAAGARAARSSAGFRL